jgi:NAD(P)H dehydrogenase (quinone)
MRVFVVFAHPEARSFGHALLHRGRAALEQAGHEVVVSDLYADGFQPVARAGDFRDRRFPDALHYDREQKFNLGRGGLADDIVAELERVRWCELLILQFPLWWFSMPAMLKGWVDRVFVNGAAYGSGRRYDTGGFRGRKAMVCITTAADPAMVSPRGLLGDLEVILWPIHNGTLAYAGFDVLAPYVGHSVAWVDDTERARILDGYEHHLAGIETRSPMFFHPLADFGSDWTLRHGIAPGTVGQRARLGP